MSLKDKVAYVTGGTKGIGLGVAKEMLSQGMKVAITGRSRGAAELIAAELSLEYVGRIIAIESDVRKFQDEKNAISKVLEHWGKLDVVIANAGVGHFCNILDMTEEQWNQTIDVNLTGVFHTTKASIASLIATNGYLITIASLAGTNFFPNGAAYNASKFGLVGFSQAVMLDVRNKGVKVTTIMPGSVSTHFNDHTPNEADAWKIQPEDIGKLVVDLLTMNPRTLPSKIEVRPSRPGGK